MELDKENYTEITGDELKKILKSLDEIRNRISTFEWDSLPIRAKFGNKDISIDLLILKNDKEEKLINE